jgi:hypothetical protein
MSARAGRYVTQVEGYRAFVPAPLPPRPPLDFDSDLVAQVVAATDAVGRLDGVTQTLPDADLFVAMYVRQEAVLSSQIEGTQSTLDDVLAFELDPGRRGLPADVTEVVNYIRAMNHGLARLQTLPLSLRLLREIHRELLSSGRGAEKTPGEFRRTQNWIGPEGATLTPGPYTWSWPTTTSWTRPSYSLCMSLTEPTDGILPPVFEPGWRATMSDDLHFDGGRLRRQNVSHRHVVEHDDGRVSAVVVRGVPAIACELCEESYYEPDVTDAIVDLLSKIEVAPGEAIAVDYRALTAA